jgi:hypothetical protein
MPVDASAARNQFLATMATIVQRGGVSGAEAMEQVAETTAAEIAQATPGIDSAELLAALPDVWKSDPKSSTTRNQMNAFLQVAGPVLGVDQGSVTPLATRGVAMGQDVDAAMAINKARHAASAPSPTLDAPLDLAKQPLIEIRDALDAAFKDSTFLESLGGQRMSYAVRELAREFAVALDYSQPGKPDEASVLAGGVEVAGPNVRKAHQALRFGTFRELPLQTSVRELATAVAEIAAVRAGLDESEMRSAVAGKEVLLESGRGPPQDAMPLKVDIQADGKIGVGLGVDTDKIRKYADNPSLDDDDLATNVGKALRREDDELAKFTQADMPVGFFLDARVQKTKTVQAALVSDG